MRPRFAVPASLLTALVVVALPCAVIAAPKHNHGLTINVTPNPVVSGEAVLIYGQLNTQHPANKLIVLYHRVNPAAHFSIIQTTRTDSVGFYEFKRAPEIVNTNRSWFVRGPGNTHSRTVHERVTASVTLAASPLTGDTHHEVTFTGHVEANHAGQRVLLQVQQGISGDDWRTIGSGRLGLGSNYSIRHVFNQPGERDVRVVFLGDARNARGVSDVVTVTIEQTQNPSFTINSSTQNIEYGQSVTISGKLLMPGSATVPDPAQTVQLYGRQFETGAYQPIGASTVTGADGSYSITAKPVHNEVYQVRTVGSTAASTVRKTAQLFEGVKDVVTINASSMSSTVGGTVTFTGAVMPNKTGHVIDLQRKGADGDWHTVKESRVTGTSTASTTSSYAISWRFGTTGTKQFRTLVPGGDVNSSGHSPAVTITVTLPPVASLPAPS